MHPRSQGFIVLCVGWSAWEFQEEAKAPAKNNLELKPPGSDQEYSTLICGYPASNRRC